jgi:hypothetical protein
MVPSPLFPSDVAVKTAFPDARPMTSPAADTVAIAASLVPQFTARPVRTFPAESRVVATSCTVPPTCTVSGVPVIVTDATGTDGVVGSSTHAANTMTVPYHRANRRDVLTGRDIPGQPT